MASVTQRGSCQDSLSDAAGAAGGGGGGDHDGAGAADPVGMSQRLLDGQSLLPAALDLTAAQQESQHLVHVDEVCWAGSPLLAQGCR